MVCRVRGRYAAGTDDVTIHGHCGPGLRTEIDGIVLFSCRIEALLHVKRAFNVIEGISLHHVLHALEMFPFTIVTYSAIPTMSVAVAREDHGGRA